MSDSSPKRSSRGLLEGKISDSADIPAILRDWTDLTDTGKAGKTEKYDRACSLATRLGADDTKLAEALKDLKFAAQDPWLKKLARADPSFSLLRNRPPDDGLRQRYKEAVGDDPPTDLLALSPFKQHTEKLSARGLDNTADLAATTPERLARRIGVEQTVAQRWWEIANLAEHPPRGGRLNIAVLHLLLQAGVDSRATLKRNLSGRQGRRDLHDAMVKGAETLTLVPTWKDTIEAWSGVSWDADQQT